MKGIHETTSLLRTAFFIVAGALILLSTLFSNKLAGDLAEEERKKIELWAEAVRLLTTDLQEGVEMDYTLNFKVMEGNTNIPVILVDSNGTILETNNLKASIKGDSLAIAEEATRIMGKKQFIEVKISDSYIQYVYYDDSSLLRKLTYFPFIQLLVMFVFLLVTVFALNASRKSEQNRVWVGLSKETAHQLGTPISSLLAWVELLKLKQVDEQLLKEIDKDTLRLKTIAERFSKIGSKPSLTPVELKPVLENALTYMRNRSSKKIAFKTLLPKEPILVNLNVPLFEWVIENLCKNAIDAMETSGTITITASSEGKHLTIDVTDTGKGIPKSHFKTVFKPGFTTKQRGWGLGLSLVKRIIEENHGGKIFVKSSEPGKGTTFRIIL
ncbi:MAG: HAMP domain-containing histidine kinase [Bacteroidales bacterium]|nr:HAMP domain-containing histidine kinase [Bacteroidales bacterium]HBL72522.1 ATP-binding protein [Bacteroidales bacterium]